MSDRELYYVLYPCGYEEDDGIIQHGIDYDKLIGYVFKKVYESNTGTVHLRSIYPDGNTLVTVDKDFLKGRKCGLRPTLGSDMCPLHTLPDDGSGKIPKCRWYGNVDGCCFLHGAGCSPLYRQDGADRKWGIPLDEEREKNG